MASTDPTPSAGDCILAFRGEMESHGLAFRGELKADGVLHRVHVEGDKKGSKNGWYKLHLDGIPAGAFGSWSKMAGSTSVKWSMKGSIKLSKAERKKLLAKRKADEKARAEAERIKHENAAAKANAVWNAAKPAPINHPYLVRKGVQPHGLRVGDWVKDFIDDETGEVTRTITVPNALLVPIYEANTGGKRVIVSLQAIFPDSKNALSRDKDFLRDGKKRGCFFVIGKPLEVDGVENHGDLRGLRHWRIDL